MIGRPRGSGVAERVDDTRTAPHPDSDTKPDSPGDVTGPSWKYTARKTFREFLDDECTDLAAALTYYAVLAVFPAIIAVLSLLGLVGQSEQVVDETLGILESVVGPSVADTLGPVVESLAGSTGAGLALATGLLVALWSASGYVTAFGRAMNRVYEIREGRPVWKLRPVMVLITLVVVVMAVIAALILVLSGPVAEAIGESIGLGSTALTVWSVAKWPVLLVVVIAMVAILYYFTPNVKQPKFRWISIGATFAIVVWILASVAFGFYVANFSNYNATYGALAGVVIFLLWVWITNLALLFGAELDAELERSRQLQGGIEAERDIQLPPRDTTKIEKTEAKEAEDVERGRELRMSGGRPDGAERK
jgi:membrane protein